MKYIQSTIAIICLLFFCANVSAQTVRPTNKSEDNKRVYDSKLDLLEKIKLNIERKQDGNDDDGPVIDPNEGRSNSNSKTKSKLAKNRKVKFPKKDN